MQGRQRITRWTRTASGHPWTRSALLRQRHSQSLRTHAHAQADSDAEDTRSSCHLPQRPASAIAPASPPASPSSPAPAVERLRHPWQHFRPVYGDPRRLAGLTEARKNLGLDLASPQRESLRRLPSRCLSAPPPPAVRRSMLALLGDCKFRKTARGFERAHGVSCSATEPAVTLAPSDAYDQLGGARCSEGMSYTSEATREFSGNKRHGLYPFVRIRPSSAILR